MDKEQILAAIDGDPEATQLAAIANDAACAERLTAIWPPVRRSIPADDVMAVAVRRGRWGSLALACHELQLAFPVRSTAKTLVDWIQAGKSIDITLAEVQSMVGVLKDAGLINDADVEAIESLAWAKVTITPIEVSIAMAERRQGAR